MPPTPPAPPAPPPSAAPTAAPPTREEASRFAAASNAFAADLWGKLRTDGAPSGGSHPVGWGAAPRQPGNLAFSPASIWMALAMTQGGARGETATEMARVMRMPHDSLSALDAAGRQLAAWNSSAQAELTLRVVNRLFGEQSATFEPAYLASTRQRWGAPLEATDFKHAAEAARAHINGWIAEQTQDRIRNLLPPASVDAQTRLVLTNAVYFLGKWAEPFAHHATSERPFYPASGPSVSVPTMSQTKAFPYGEVDGVQVLEMPYRGGDYAMTLILPRARDGLAAVEGRVDAATLDRWVAATSPTRVVVSLPKFTIDPAESLSLGPILTALGMRLAFDRVRADFTGIATPPSPDDRLFIGMVLHKAFVKVDEEGTEAAAATAVPMQRMGSALTTPPPEFTADHPFLFLLRDTRTGVILFMGRVQDPR